MNVGDLIPIGRSGNAKTNEVLQDKTFSSNDGTDLVGTMPNMGSKIITPTTYTQTFRNGYYDLIKVNGDSNLKPENIRNGTSVFGVQGNAIVLNKGVNTATILDDNTIKTISSNYETFYKLKVSVDGTFNILLKVDMTTNTANERALSLILFKNNNAVVAVSYPVTTSNGVIYTFDRDITLNKNDIISIQMKKFLGYSTERIKAISFTLNLKEVELLEVIT
ncbi:hypothetical protein [Clostridium brassicae]|uniref:Uncharacterized protein n=1 Tax=Clostridium brassicae TaxID=2999072 RepID=A0ABT4DCC6_9CLOT|nr:hypothetical protein [Clostridium brassicae]MCY6958881.1 hypothetical protein [Clostridium brassicae]